MNDTKLPKGDHNAMAVACDREGYGDEGLRRAFFDGWVSRANWEIEQSNRDVDGSVIDRLMTDRPELGVCDHGTDRSTDLCVICDKERFPAVEPTPLRERPRFVCKCGTAHAVKPMYCTHYFEPTVQAKGDAAIAERARELLGQCRAKGGCGDEIEVLNFVVYGVNE